jgi:hypothetical protein
VAPHRKDALRMACWAGVGLFVVAGLYVVFIRLAWGQRLDDLATEGRKATDLTARRAVTSAMRASTVPVLLVVTLVGAVQSVRSRRWRAGIGIALAVLATAASARLLKGVLPRPDLLAHSFMGPDNSFPSGHSAVAAAVALGAVTLATSATRRTVSAMAAGWLSLQTMAVLGSGWHRVSDVVAGLALGVATVGAASAVLVATGATRTRGSDLGCKKPWRLGRSLTAAAGSCVLVLLMLRNPPNAAHSFLSYLAAVVASVSVAIAAVWTHAVLGAATPELDGVSSSRAARR